jgi:hypothetical protein
VPWAEALTVAIRRLALLRRATHTPRMISSPLTPLRASGCSVSEEDN